jgi:hypothetical protein
MGESEAKSWTGGAYWHRWGKTSWSKTEQWFTRYATWPFVTLCLDDEGGALFYARSSGPETSFVWNEIERMERVRVLGIPFFGEGVRSTFRVQAARGIPRRWLFFSFSKGRTLDILGRAQSKGVSIERRAKNTLVVP